MRALLLLFFLICAAAGTLFACGYRLYRRYPQPLMTSYLLFLSAWCAFGVFGFFASVLAPALLPAESGRLLGVLHLVLLLPLLVGMLFFFCRFVARIAGTDLPRGFRRAFVFLAAALFLAVLLSSLTMLWRPDLDNPLLRLPILRLVKDVILAGAILWLGRRSLRQPNERRRGLVALTAALAAWFVTSEIGLMGLWPMRDPLTPHLATLAALFGMQGLVLLPLRRILAEDAAARRPAGGATAERRTILAGYGLSRRETEVAELLLIGLSNRQIEDKLFISLDTVKKHIYNIYRKTGARSRVQFVRLVEYGGAPDEGRSAL